MGKEIIHNGFYKEFEGENVADKLMEIECCHGGYCVSAFLLGYSDFFAYSLMTTEKSHIEGLLDKNGRIIHYFRTRIDHRDGKAFTVFIDARGETDSFREFVDPFYPIRAADHARYDHGTVMRVDDAEMQVYITKKYDEATWDELCHSFAALIEKYGYWRKKLPLAE